MATLNSRTFSREIAYGRLKSGSRLQGVSDSGNAERERPVVAPPVVRDQTPSFQHIDPLMSVAATITGYDLVSIKMAALSEYVALLVPSGTDPGIAAKRGKVVKIVLDAAGNVRVVRPIQRRPWWKRWAAK